MKFQETFNKNGEKRSYYLGEDGREYLIYQDRTGYVIRDMCNEDIEEWLSVMIGYKGASLLEIALQKASISSKIEKSLDDNDSLERTMVILNPAGQLIGSIDFTEQEDGSGCKIMLFLENQKIVDTKGKRVLEVLMRMNKQENLYDELWMENSEKELIQIA